MTYHHGTDQRFKEGCRCEFCVKAHNRELRYYKPEPKPARQEPTTAWTARALCAGYPSEWWFPEHGFPPPEAFALCARCPVVEPCREEGKRELGLWGGVYRGVKTSKRYRPEVRCVDCGGLFVRTVGTVDRKCDSCCTPNEMTHRRARNRKRVERQRRADLEREVAEFERAVDECETEASG